MISILKNNYNYNCIYKGSLNFFLPRIKHFFYISSLNSDLKNLKLYVYKFIYRSILSMNDLSFLSINLKHHNYKYNFLSSSKCLISLSSKQILKKLDSSNISSKKESSSLNYKSLKFIKTSILFLFKFILSFKIFNEFAVLSLIGKNFVFFFNLKLLINYISSTFNFKGNSYLYYIWYPKLSKFYSFKKKKSIKKRLKKSNLYSFKDY